MLGVCLFVNRKWNRPQPRQVATTAPAPSSTSNLTPRAASSTRAVHPIVFWLLNMAPTSRPIRKAPAVLVRRATISIAPSLMNAVNVRGLQDR